MLKKEMCGIPSQLRVRDKRTTVVRELSGGRGG
jgi:hypothetical protein